MPAPPCTPYWLYLLECEDGVYYAGIALDVERRFFQHVFGLGARFTRARPPVRVLAACQYASKGEALRAEFKLKALPRASKLAFFETCSSKLRAVHHAVCQQSVVGAARERAVDA